MYEQLLNIYYLEENTHMDNEGSGTGVLGHPSTRSARRRVFSPPVPERLIIHVCKVRVTE